MSSPNQFREEELSFFGSNVDGENCHSSDAKSTSKALIVFDFHPGFYCFFQDYVERKNWTFYQCYKKVFQSHHQMAKIRLSPQDILKNTQLSKPQMMQEFMKRAEKQKNYAIYSPTADTTDELQLSLITNEDKKLEQLQTLKQALEKLQQIKRKVVSQKKLQFQKKQIEKSKQQQKEIQELMTEKERRANLVREIQQKAEAKHQKLLIQKSNSPNRLPQKGSHSWCQIM